MFALASSKLLLYAGACCFLLFYNVPHHVVAASPFSFSFDFSNSSTYRSADLRFEGDAAQHGDLVDLTCNSMAQPFKNCTGRASYKHPVPLYDTTTGVVASFATRFTFAIKPGKVRGDGMAFFLTGYPSRLPLASRRGDLGLHDGGGRGTARFIAVEFDTYRDSFDPCDTGDHIAIDINSTRDSMNTTCLPSSSLEGSMTASITFNSSTNMLLASLHLDDDPSHASYQVSMHLPDPVTSLLPPEVVVGFSAAAGSYFEYHQILSWSFDSTLATRRETSPPAPQPKPAPVATGKETSRPGPQPKPAFVVTRKKIGEPEAQPKLAFMVTRKDQTSVDQTSNSSVPEDQSNFNSSAPEGQQTFNSFVPEDTERGVTSHATPGLSLIIGVAFPVIFLFIAVIWISLASYKHKHQDDLFVNGAPESAKRFEYYELVIATDKFSKQLGKGGFGVVYEGKLMERGHQYQVAVKKLNRLDGEANDFHAELNIISETRHKNLVKLKGWCTRNRSNVIDFMCWWRQKQGVELFLVFELVPQGNLDMHLHQNRQVLPWERRYKIVKDVGTALRYLHYECDNCILHRDIKPGNILLDENFNAKLADFGLSRIAHYMNESASDYRSTAVVQTKAVGTREYMDPNCIKNGTVIFTRSTDVYSFGRVLLEIACTGKSRADVWEQYNRDQENMAAVADARLRGNFNVTQMKHVAVLGLWCSLPDDHQRPTMQQAMDVLEGKAILPKLRG